MNRGLCFRSGRDTEPPGLGVQLAALDKPMTVTIPIRGLVVNPFMGSFSQKKQAVKWRHFLGAGDWQSAG
jgi:hypothetical protein